MTSADFTPLASLMGGALIGASAALLLTTVGRIAGISGIAGGLVARPARGDIGWRVSFLVGLVLAGVVIAALTPSLFEFAIVRSTATLIAAGLLVGFGTRLGSGCTSGHGVCGISRLSKRSILATITFMATGVLTVWVVEHGLGGMP